MDPQYSTLPTFSASFLASGYRILVQKMAAGPKHFHDTLLSVIAGRVCVTSGACRLADGNWEFLGVYCTVGDAYKTRRTERNACV